MREAPKGRQVLRPGRLCRPLGTHCAVLIANPWADAHGYIMSPLRGWGDGCHFASRILYRPFELVGTTHISCGALVQTKRAWYRASLPESSWAEADGGLRSIKIFIGSSTGDLLVDEQSALEAIFAETDLPICAHCEDEATVRANRDAIGGGSTFRDHSKIRDHKAALIATKRAVDLAERHQHRFHVLHVSTGDEVDFLRTTSELITAEACPHHLLFHLDDYDRLGSLVQMNPSIKTADDNARIWTGLLDGTIQVIATDHAPHTSEEKNQSYPASPSGLPAVENVLALMLNEVSNGRCTLQQVVNWMCEAPAAVWNLARKGRIEVDYDADIAIIDLDAEHTVRNSEQVTKCGWSPWDGVTLTGQNQMTIVQGDVVYDRGVYREDLRGAEVQFDR